MKQHWMLIVIVALGLVYIGKAYSPSSYALAANALQFSSKADFGSPKSIRSDEWAVQTPLTQAVVRNGFERFNHTSVYNEDLRISYALPILDWGAIFKPTQWLYFVVPPAYAFSFHYYALFALFVVGFTFMLERLGLARPHAFAFSVALYFTGGIQFWWTVNGATFAFFPWAMLAMDRIRHTAWHALALAWLLACWQISNFYPPFTYALALVGLAWMALVHAHTRYTCRHLAIASFASLVAAAIVGLYFVDYLSIMSTTAYPGMRSVQGGGATTWRMLESLVLPSAHFDRRYDLLPVPGNAVLGNVVESGVISTILPLAILFFCRHTVDTWRNIAWTLRWPAAILAGVALWCLAPVPASVGHWVLLDKVPPNRLFVAFALLIQISAVVAAMHLPTNVSARRIVLFWLALAGLALAFKMSPKLAERDLIAAAIAMAVSLLLWWRLQNPAILLWSAPTLYAVLIFFPFNPVQNAKLIFADQTSPLTQRLETMQARDGYVVENMPGAVLNGAGFRSVAHVNTLPQTTFWRHKFPSIPDTTFNDLFNRYAHILLDNGAHPHLQQADLIFVPLHCFQNVPLDAPCPATSSANTGIQSQPR